MKTKEVTKAINPNGHKLREINLTMPLPITANASPSKSPLVKVGDIIENPVTGEKMVFLQTGAETAGQLLQIDMVVKSGGFVPVEHLHPFQAEHFVVKSGRITMHIAGQEQTLTAGEEVTVPPATPHIWWNSGDEGLHIVLEFRPAGRFDRYITSLFALAQAGKTNAQGMVSPLRYAVIDREYNDVVVMTKPPRAVQQVLFALLYPLGRLLGYQADYIYPPSTQPSLQQFQE
jgi:mannose-6-phosphate isomerase-like protein (cupin superfamily)